MTNLSHPAALQPLPTVSRERCFGWYGTHGSAQDGRNVLRLTLASICVPQQTFSLSKQMSVKVSYQSLHASSLTTFKARAGSNKRFWQFEEMLSVLPSGGGYYYGVNVNRVFIIKCLSHCRCYWKKNTFRLEWSVTCIPFYHWILLLFDREDSPLTLTVNMVQSRVSKGRGGGGCYLGNNSESPSGKKCGHWFMNQCLSVCQSSLQSTG